MNIMKTTLLLMGISFGLAGISQTYELADTLSTGDMTSYFVLDSNANNLSGITGADVTWDYSSIGAINIPANNDEIIDRVESDFAADFPDADYCENFENSVQTFFTNSAADNIVYVYGFVFEEISNDFVIAYDEDPLEAARFPMNVGDTYDDDIVGKAIIPLAGEVALDGSATVSADGSGTLIVGDVTYTDVIRIHTIEITEGLILASPATITRDSYVYYQEGTRMPVFIHANILAELGAGGDFGFTAVYAQNEVTDYVSIEDNELKTTNLNVFPNPAASNMVTISTETGTERIVIRNTVGQTVLDLNQPKSSEMIDVSTFEKGVYIIEATKGSTTTTQKLILQ
jgi:hypothetical protein